MGENSSQVKRSCKLHITSQYNHETYTLLCKGHITSHYMKRILRSPKFPLVHLRLPWLTSVCLGSPQFPLVHLRLPWLTLVCLGSP